MRRIVFFPIKKQSACPSRRRFDVGRGEFNADKLGNGVQLPHSIIFASRTKDRQHTIDVVEPLRKFGIHYGHLIVVKVHRLPGSLMNIFIHE